MLAQETESVCPCTEGGLAVDLLGARDTLRNKDAKRNRSSVPILEVKIMSGSI